MTDLFEERRTSTDEIVSKFGETVKAHLGNDMDRVIGDHTTVYVTGSGGRGEMSAASDLDLFLVRADTTPSRLDAVVLQASILRATRDCEIPEPSADGAFLEMHAADEFERMLGSQEDDAKNKFTARMLLLLESRPVLGVAAYNQIIDRMIKCYWSTTRNHEQDYLPFMFVNDVIRYWRVVLLNHESRLLIKREELRKKGADGDGLASAMATERYVRSFKLRFARCLTCFASMAYLLAHTNNRLHVDHDDMRAMIRKTPLERLTAASEMARRAEVDQIVEKMRTLYESFLDTSARPKDELIRLFSDQDTASAHAKRGSEFADAMFDLLHALGMPESGKRNPLYRYMLV